MGSRVLLSLIAGAILLTACGGDDTDDSGAVRPDGAGGQEASARLDELAAQMLLTLDDLPAGVVEDLSDDESSEDDAADRCDDPARQAEVIGEAESKTFASTDQFLEIDHAVEIFTSAEAASRNFEGVSELGRCVTEVLNGGELDTDEVAFTNFRFEPLAAPDQGDESAAYRLSGSIIVLEAGVELPAHFDLIGARTGRVFTQLRVVSSPGPPEAELERSLLSTALDRAMGLAP